MHQSEERGPSRGLAIPPQARKPQAAAAAPVSQASGPDPATVRGERSEGASIASPTHADPAGALPQEARRWVRLVVSATRNSPIKPALVLAIMHTESSFDPLARSRTGACGLMQLIPEAGARAAFSYLTGCQYRIPKACLFRPHLNVVLGIAYLEWLWTRRFSTIDQGAARAYVCVAAYNAGPGRINRWLSSVGLTERDVTADKQSRVQSIVSVLTSRLPWPETRRFVKLVAARWPQYDRWLAVRRSFGSGVSTSG